MAVPALELRPRRAVALVDAAVRLCLSVSGVWTLGLVAGAAITAPVLGLMRAVRLREGLAAWALGVAIGWCVRAVLQGAMCQLLEDAVLTPEPPSSRAAIRKALRHAPALVITSGVLFALNLISLPLTLGLAVLFLSNGVVGYAVAMRGQGHPLGVYATATRLLGPARTQVAWVRLALWWWPLLVLCMHVCVAALLMAGEQLLAIDLAYAQRYVSISHGDWLVVLSCVAFTLLEPLRAAIAVLLLVDGRVRQEGLDLRAQVDQLPSRRTSRASGSDRPAATAAMVLLAVGLACFPPRAWAGGTPSAGSASAAASHQELAHRLERIAEQCEVDLPGGARTLQRIEHLPANEHTALARFVEDLENTADEYEDCDAAAARLESAIPVMLQEVDATPPLPDAAGRARQILSRPEFVTAPELPKEAAPAKDPNPAASWWRRLLEWLAKWLREQKRTPVKAPEGMGNGSTAAMVIGGVVVLAVVGVLGLLLLRIGNGERKAAPQLEPDDAGPNPATASSTLPDARSRTTEAWALDADALAARGQFREAVRSLYLALLSRLHREGAIDYDPAHSNWDYLRHFRGELALKPPLRELTLRFDHAFYGRAEVGLDGYQSFRTLCAPLLALAPEPRGA